MKPLDDKAIRHCLLADLASHNESGVVFEEVGILRGNNRIDLLSIGHELHGYEIKSGVDTLRRLEGQAWTYSQVLDRVTIVVASVHVRDVMARIPGWWGIIVAVGRAGHVNFVQLRDAKPNPSPNGVALANLLWRDEAIEILSRHGKAVGRRPVRKQLCEQLAVSLEAEVLRYEVCRALRARENWLPAYKSDKCDD